MGTSLTDELERAFRAGFNAGWKNAVFREPKTKNPPWWERGFAEALEEWRRAVKQDDLMRDG